MRQHACVREIVSLARLLAQNQNNTGARQDAHLKLARGDKLLVGIQGKDKSAQEEEEEEEEKEEEKEKEEEEEVCMIERIMAIIRTSGIQYIRTHMQLGRRGLTCTSSSLALECAK
jgi:hypothetical protein